MTTSTYDAASHNQMAFAAWSGVYDMQTNPLLSLEERYLRQVLPSVDDKDVLDLGCGTGRWLTNINQIGLPKTLQGIDGSPEMLSIAKNKQIPNVSLVNAQLPGIPLQSESIDLCIASFVLSYISISNITLSANEIARVLRNSADLFIADMHPETAAELGWQRSFCCGETNVSLHNEFHTIEVIACSLRQFGLRLVASYEPSFGQPELSDFQYRGKEDLYHKAFGKPAIYLLHFKRDDASIGRHTLIKNVSLVLGAEELIDADLMVDETSIATINAKPLQLFDSNHIDLSGYTLFPGLINAHDHLEFALFPRLGTPPYRNATQWALDIQDRYSEIIAVQRQVPKWIRLWWGALRNLLCGVTTVCHHNPLHSSFNDPRFPVRVTKDFGWAHSLAFSEDLTSGYLQTHPSHPFILHACEGVDSDAANEFSSLEALNVIGEHTVLVHGLALTPSEIDRCNRCGTSIIACPSSNQFLFAKMPSLKQLSSVNRLAIGNDSPLSAIGDLLDEVRFCNEELCIAPARLFDCVTRSAARILRLKWTRGVITPGYSMDCFAVKSSILSPGQHLTALSWKDIELVIVNGVVRLASTEMLQRLPSNVSKQLTCLLVENEPRWLDAPIDTLFQSAARVLGTENLSFSGRTLSIPEP